MTCDMPHTATAFHPSISIMEPTLPLDILLSIIDLLGAGNDRNSIRSLQILSQTCKFMVPLCRKHLFSSLHLDSDSSLQRFGDLLSKNPDISRYVKSLIYIMHNFTSVHELNILELPRERSSLRSIKLLTPRYLDWNSFPESIRSSMLSLIQLPTVTNLDITYFKGFPTTALSSCSNLISVQLGELRLDPHEVNQAIILRSNIPSSVSLVISIRACDLAELVNLASLHAGGPIVDFSRVQKVMFDVISPDD